MKLQTVLKAFTPNTLNIVVLIVGVLVLAAVLYYSCANREGFMGSIPSATQTSAIPSDTPGATTSDPTVAKPQTKDIQAAMDELDAFLALANSLKGQETQFPTETQQAIQQYRLKEQALRESLKQVVESPEASPMTLKDVTDLRTQLANLSMAIRSGPPAQSYESTVVAGAPGVISLNELRELVSRIEAEHLRLANLRSTSVTILARQTQLEKLAADVREMIGAVERKEMKLEDVPISPSSAEAFLKQLDTKSQLPPLIEPRAKIADGLQAQITPVPAAGTDVRALHGLLENTKYLKWKLEVKLEYDPKYAAREDALKHLETIEQRLSTLAVSETPIRKEMYDVYTKELQAIHAAIAPEGKEAAQHAYERPVTAYTRNLNESAADFPSVEQLSTASSVHDSASGNAVLNAPKQVSPDVWIRPGFVMNDDTIQRRASASAFDESVVGGPDYKKRSQELCRQIRGANLGEPSNFGCISNPDEVSPEYSWKGNFTMICSRLGDTWGGWMPEMFGCAKYDPTQKFKATMM
jgi:hypothetical protein